MGYKLTYGYDHGGTPTDFDDDDDDESLDPNWQDETPKVTIWLQRLGQSGKFSAQCDEQGFVSYQGSGVQRRSVRGSLQQACVSLRKAHYVDYFFKLYAAPSGDALTFSKSSYPSHNNGFSTVPFIAELVYEPWFMSTLTFVSP